jgi:hypothetical protein
MAYWDRSRGQAVAMISNSDLSPWTLITLQRGLVAALAGREPDHAARPVFVSLDSAERASIAGRYVVPRGDTISVTNADAGLRLRINGGLEFDVFHIMPDAFYVPGPDYFVGFSGEAAVRQMHVRSMFVDIIALRIP